MITIHSTKIYYFDVDNTLVFPESDSQRLKLPPSDPIYMGGRRFYVHLAHLELMRDLKARGHTVIVWSAGGSHWAEAVVKMLKMDQVVDLVISKPDGICDDKYVTEWVPTEDWFFIPFGRYEGEGR
jgi:hydroxymethylpyrimidine pyrophosphatase-like HAD family hydrolase